MSFPARAHHDVGGANDGEINRREHDLDRWELEADALLRLLRDDCRRLVNTHEFRRAVESIDADRYRRLSYYGRWIEAIALLLVEKGIAARAEFGWPRGPDGNDRTGAGSTGGGHDGHDHHDTDDHASRRLGRSVIDALATKGIITKSELDAEVARTERWRPQNGARVVARAWCDSEYKGRLLTHANLAVGELDIDIGPTNLGVFESTPRIHHLIVCTLCSCYPKFLLGPPPAWYKSLGYRSRAVSEPRKVLAEFGTVLPSEVEVRVHDSTADFRYMVLPLRPAGTDDLGEEKLARLVTRDNLIGVTRPSMTP